MNMKIRIFILSFLLLPFLNGCGSSSQNRKTQPVRLADIEKKYQPEEIRQDMKFLFTALENIHPNLYAFTPKDTIDELRRKVGARLNHPMTKLEFWQLVAPIVTKLRDGHTGLYFPYEFRKYYLDHDGKIFPFDVQVEEDRLFIVRNYSADSLADIGSQILSVNGIPAASILEKMRLYHSGERKSFIDLMVAKNFKPFLWALYGFGYDFDVAFISSVNGKKYINRFAGISSEKLSSLQSPTTNSSKPYSYYPIPNEKIGVINFRSMRNSDKFKEFLKTTFAKIRRDSVQSLIIDIRKNGGGDSRLADDLFKYITKKTYTQALRMDMKTSKETKSFLKKKFLKWYLYPIYPLLYFHPTGRAILFKKSGMVTTFEFKPQKPKISQPFFSGNIYLLTGPNTFSSANILAAVFKCYKMGTIIGEETGGLTIAYGDVIPYRLPHTNLRGGCSFKRFVHPCGKKDGHGVIPDIEVKQKPEGARMGVDTVLQYTIDYIKNKEK